jgi:hypothetical protein
VSSGNESTSNGDPFAVRWPGATSRWSGPVVVTAAVLLLRLPSLVGQLFDPDEAALSVQALGLRDGGTMYVDAIDRKPPIAVYLYAASHWVNGSTDLRPLHLLAAIALIATALLIASEGRRIAGERAGWTCAALLIAGMLAFIPVDGQSANYAHFALLPGTAAMVFARRGRVSTAFLAGLALGLATLTRQTWAIGAIPAAIAMIRHGRPAPQLAAATVGGLLPLGVLAMVMPFGDFRYWVFSSNESFLFGDIEVDRVALRVVLMTALFVAGHSVMLVATVSARRRIPLDLLLWVAVGMVAVFAGFRLWGHYWMQVLPPLALIGGIELATWEPARRRTAWTVVAATGVVAFGLAWVPDLVRSLPDPTELAAVVDAETAPSDRVLVWGNFAEVLHEAERRPAAGFVTMDFVTGRAGGRPVGPQTVAGAPDRALPQLLAVMRTDPPAMIIDTAPADIRGYGAYPISTFPELAAIVADRYELDRTVSGADVYLLIDTD